MSFPNNKDLDSIQFYVTTKYSCGYIKHQSAQSLVATPYKKVNNKAYSNLIKQGFRRSGQYVYKPHCGNCQACIPIRLSVNNFSISRSQKRVKKTHSNIQAKVLPLKFNEEHYELYIQYQNNRHRSQNESEDDIADYNEFLIRSNVESKLIEFRLNNKLVMISIIDLLEDGVSAVYTFYNCRYKKNSFGTFSILWLIDYCINHGIPYLYLGYWINQSNKMRYKINFKPYELMIDSLWQEASN